MSFMDRLRGAQRTQPDAGQAVGSIAEEGNEPGLMSQAAENDAEQSSRDERSGADPQTDTAAKVVSGERGIPSVNRERSIHARVTNALAIGVMVVLGLGFLSYYYSTAFKRRADEDQRVKDGAASKAAGEISNTMNVIQEITTQTNAGTNETAASIGNLTELANDLRRSVAGFKLPE